MESTSGQWGATFIFTARQNTPLAWTASTSAPMAAGSPARTVVLALSSIARKTRPSKPASSAPVSSQGSPTTAMDPSPACRAIIRP